MKPIIILTSIFFAFCIVSKAQTFTITGKVLSKKTKQIVPNATISLQGTNEQIVADGDGSFKLKITSGNYTLQVSSTGFYDYATPIVVDKNLVLNIELNENAIALDSVTIAGAKEKTSGFTRLHDVEGTAIYAGKKTEVIVLKDVIGNKATNNSRQIYAKVAGLNIWENDGGAGLQLAIGGRGLSPNRVGNFNTRQNGYDMSADALGYPESYYTPPAEAMERIEIVRGAASLQYGTQFGGMINFKLNRGPEDKKIEIISRLSGGSFNFFNTSTSVGGQVGNLNYYAFFQHKSGNGWRPNGEFNANTGYAGVAYNLNSKIAVTLQYTHMDYLAHQPGGLTDAEFAADPQQSVRTRNWFKVDWNLGAAIVDYKITKNLTFNSRVFSLSASRDALGILTFINRIDDGSDRNLYVDHYKNWGNESRFLYNYEINKVVCTALVGFRYYNGHTNREQGYGNNLAAGNKSDFAYTPTLANNTLRYSRYVFPEHNIALFAENIFRINNKLSIIPGLRFEDITTKAQGDYTNVAFDLAGNPISPQKITDNKKNSRNFIIGGLGITYNVVPSIQLYINFSQNYKAINFNDLRTQNPNLRVDSNLQDEKGYSADLGIRKNMGILNYDISFFYINYDNKIGSILSVDPVSNVIYNLRANVAKTRHMGIETYVEADIWKWIKRDAAKMSLSLFSNFSVLSAKYINGPSSIKNNAVEFVPNIIFKTGVAFRKNKFGASYQFSYTAKQFTDATNATFTEEAIAGLVPSYTIMDLSAQYQINKVFSLYGSLNNIADKKYFTRRADSYPGPGIVPSDPRTFYLTLQVKL